MVRFEALHYPDRVRTVNPLGDVGLITLWSPLRTVERKLGEVAPDVLDPQRSRVAAVSNLYGDGMFAMFCNLLYNPQVTHLVALGEDLGLGTCDEIDAFLEHGLEETEMLGKRLMRVRGTGRLFPAADGFDADRLRRMLSFRRLGKLSHPALGEELSSHLRDLAPGTPGERVRVELPEPGSFAYRPSHPGAHQVVRRRPLDAWEELVVRGVRFGRPVVVDDGPRIELLNAKAVITDPQRDPAPALARYGFALDRFLEYERKMFTRDLPEGIEYTYGNRLAAPLDGVIAELRERPGSRRAYASIWDTASDLTAGAAPCLTTLFFRRDDEGLLTLTATYRAHNLLTAWLENVYGLMAIQRHVAEATDMAPGALTVISHSLGIDPRNPRYDLARAIADAWTRDDDLDRESGKFSLREDPHGYFVVSADRERGRIVAEHRFGGVLVKRYEGERAKAIEAEVAADMAVSLISHAMWLGRELAAKERQLRGD